MSCHRKTAPHETKFWTGAQDQQLPLCPRCHDMAQGARAELVAGMRRAEQHALLELTEMILKGQLLRSPGAYLPGFGDA